jgi:hypothetical protein
MAETLRHLRDAIANIEQTGGEQMPDLMWANRRHPAAMASWLNRLVTFPAATARHRGH